MFQRETCWRTGCRTRGSVGVINDVSVDAIYTCGTHIAGAAKLNEAVEELRRAWTTWAAVTIYS